MDYARALRALEELRLALDDDDLYRIHEFGLHSLQAGIEMRRAQAIRLLSAQASEPIPLDPELHADFLTEPIEAKGGVCSITNDDVPSHKFASGVCERPGEWAGLSLDGTTVRIACGNHKKFLKGGDDA